MTSPFGLPGEWLRCQLHSHTTCSDGELSPAELVAHYREAGCDVLAITDHWLITRADEHAGGMLLLPASELSAHVDRPQNEAEVLALGIEALPEPREEFPSIADCARWVVEQGGVGFLAHPYWSALVADDYLAAREHLSGIEIWNGGSEVAQGSGLSTVHWDDILHHDPTCLGIATDDTHSPPGDSRLGWTVVRVAERTRAAVLEALRSGAFYASSGGAIEDVRLVDGAVEVRTSPARSVTLRSGAWDGGRANADPALLQYRAAVVERDATGLIVAARFELPEYWPWGRVEMEDARGGRAWSNPMPLPVAGAS